MELENEEQIERTRKRLLFDTFLKEFVKLGRELSDIFPDRVYGYPKYLPSFDEFVEDLDNITTLPPQGWEAKDVTTNRG